MLVIFDKQKDRLHNAIVLADPNGPNRESDVEHWSLWMGI